MRTVQTLIDEAAAFCSGRTALARRIDVDPAQITKWANRTEPISPESVALLCDVLQLSGEETRRLAALAIVENPKNARKAERLRRAFFVSWAIGVGFAPLAIPREGEAIAQGYEDATGDRLHIVRTYVETTVPGGWPPRSPHR